MGLPPFGGNIKDQGQRRAGNGERDRSLQAPCRGLFCASATLAPFLYPELRFVGSGQGRHRNDLVPARECGVVRGLEGEAHQAEQRVQPRSDGAAGCATSTRYCQVTAGSGKSATRSGRMISLTSVLSGGTKAAVKPRTRHESGTGGRVGHACS